MERSCYSPGVNAGAAILPGEKRVRRQRPGRVARRTGLRIAMLVTMLAAAAAWLFPDPLVQAVSTVWHHAVLPGFHALLLSGLGLCS